MPTAAKAPRQALMLHSTANTAQAMCDIAHLRDIQDINDIVRLERKIGLGLQEIGEVTGIGLLRIGQLAERPEADVQAEVHAGDTVDACVEQAGDVGGGVRVVGRVARRCRLVELYPLAPRCGELADLVEMLVDVLRERGILGPENG